MSNPTAEVRFDHGGTAYRFVFDFYAAAILQRATKVPSAQFFADGKEWGADDVLMVFYAGLYRHHKLTEEHVADLIGELGVERVQELIAEALDLAGDKGASGKARPPVAKASGTSTRS